MLDYFANQASGLIGLGAQPGPRMMAVVSHADEQAELPLLWQLCLALVNFGYTVTVLDATTEESESNPGLAQLLEDSRWSGDEDRQPGAWTVLPAATGIQSLCAAPTQPPPHHLNQLGRLFAQGSVVILYCKAEWMIPLIGESVLEPLLAISPAKSAMLTGYLALKRLLIAGKLKPTIVNMIPASSAATSIQARSVAAGLGACAKRFLGYETKVIDVAEQNSDVLLYGETQRLALRLLESAVAMGGSSYPEGAGVQLTHFGHVDHFAGSH
jgi:hypothetical protein